jgi:hypothetical protein
MAVTDKQDAKAAFAAKQYLLRALIADEHLDDAGLAASLARPASSPTNGWSGRSATPAALPQPTADERSGLHQPRLPGARRSPYTTGSSIAAEASQPAKRFPALR